MIKERNAKVYTTTDGTEFFSRDEAMLYEFKNITEGKFKSNMTKGQAIKIMLDNAEFFHAHLGSYLKAIGRSTEHVATEVVEKARKSRAIPKLPVPDGLKNEDIINDLRAVIHTGDIPERSKDYLLGRKLVMPSGEEGKYKLSSAGRGSLNLLSRRQKADA